MATWWVRGVQYSGGTNDGTSDANAFIGTKRLSDKLNDGTVQSGDTVEFSNTNGPFTIAEAADWPASVGITTALSNTSAGGIILGSAQGAASSLSGRRLSMQNGTGQAHIDYRGATATGQRAVAALRLRGEDWTLSAPKITAPNWAYIRSSTGSTRIAGPTVGGDAEQASFENIGLMALGSGFTIEDFDLSGGFGWCRYALYVGVNASQVSGASNNKQVTIRRGQLYGCHSGFQIQPFGPTGTDNDYEMRPGTRLLLHDVFIDQACWGIYPGELIKARNAAGHGNGGGMLGRWAGRAIMRDFEATGEYQDGFAMGFDSGVICLRPYIHDIGIPLIDEWQWGTSWTLQTGLANGEGNGVKMGLSSATGTGVPPTTWLGTDGTSSGLETNINLPELRNILHGARIVNCQGMGVTSNNSSGAFIGSCEIFDTGRQGIALFMPAGKVGNFFLHNNFIRKLTSEPTNAPLHIQAGCRVWAYNNVSYSNQAVGTQRDVIIDSTSGLVKDKNLLVTGRIGGSNAAGWNTANDISVQVPPWTDGAGLPAGHALRTAGTRAGIQAARSHGANRSRSGALWPAGNLPLGCYQ